jgi:hypothetical protein
MAMKKKSGGNYSLSHASQNKGKAIGVPTKVNDSLPKGGGAGTHASQSKGSAIGVPTRSNSTPSMGACKPLNGGGIFKTSGSVLKNSGVKGAHRLGSKK